jgi:hypothetical protein
MIKKVKKKRGIALATIIGIIAVLVIIAIGIIVALKHESISVMSSSDLQKATKLADAGIQRAIGEIEKDAKSEFIDDLGDSWTAGYTDNTLLGGLGEYDVTIVDCQRQVNINNASANLLAELPGIDAALAAAIIAARPFETKREIMKVAGIGEGTYNNLKDYITIVSWSDPSCNDRSPININTADEIIVKAVLKGTGLSDASVNTAYTALNGAITGLGPFYLWNDFDNVIDSTSLNATEKDIIKTNANPNRIKPANNTTEFCFFSGGYYEITSTGKIYETTNQNNIAAIRTINTVVQLFKTIYYTTKEDFRGEDANYNLVLDAGEDLNGNGVLDVPTIQMVNWMDTCPINSTQDNGSSYAAGYDTLSDALKLGYWDNFDEDNDNVNKEGWSWRNWLSRNEVNYPMNISDKDSDGNNELWASIGPYGCYGTFELKDTEGWQISKELSVRANVVDTFGVIGDGRDDAPSIEFFKSGSAEGKYWISPFGFLYDDHTHDRIDITKPSNTVAVDPDNTPREGKDFFDAKVCLHFWGAKEMDRFYHTGNILYGIPVCGNDHYSNWAADQSHDQYHGVSPDNTTFKLVVSSSYGTPNYRAFLAVGSAWHQYYDYSNGYKIVGLWAFAPTSTNYILIPLHNFSEPNYDRYGYWGRKNIGSNNWDITNFNLTLCENKVQVAWDDIRVITPSGYYETYWHQPDEGNVEWGSVLYNKSIPVSASSASETVTMSVNCGSGFGNVANNSGINATSNNCKIRINLNSNDSDYSETPLVEDFYATYIISPKTIYYTYEED